MNLKIKKLYKSSILPVKANEDDACFDIYADLICDNEFNDDVVVIPPHKTVLIHTGFATEIPKGYWAPIFARSGLATKRFLRPSQGVAVIDAGYRGEWLVPLHNDSDVPQSVKHGERIAQFMISECIPVCLVETEEFSESTRGTGGFGFSGKF